MAINLNSEFGEQFRAFADFARNSGLDMDTLVRRQEARQWQLCLIQR